MISTEFRFEDFASAVQGKDYLDIIYLAEQEALHAWRKAHPSKGLSGPLIDRSAEYQAKLLGLIDFLRHGYYPKTCRENDFERFRDIRENV